MKRFIVAVALASALAAPATLLAQDKGYVGLSAGQATVQDFCNGAAQLGIACSERSSTWRLYGGLALNKHLGAELGYANLGSVDASAAGLQASVKSRVWDVTAVLNVPISGKLSGFARAGVYFADSDLATNFGLSASDSNSDLTFGAGVRYALTDRLGVRGEWQRYRGVGSSAIGEADIDVFSAGLSLRF